jgi:hypothetical protein
LRQRRMPPVRRASLRSQRHPHCGLMWYPQGRSAEKVHTSTDPVLPRKRVRKPSCSKILKCEPDAREDRDLVRIPSSTRVPRQRNEESRKTLSFKTRAERDLMLVLHRPIEPTTQSGHERRKIAAAQNDRVLIWQLHHGEGHDASREE